MHKDEEISLVNVNEQSNSSDHQSSYLLQGYNFQND